MVSIVIHFLLGLGCIGWIVASNPKIYAKPAGGAWLSPLECVYYIAGIASIALGYWFNVHFVLDAHGQGNLHFRGPPAIRNSSRDSSPPRHADRATRTT